MLSKKSFKDIKHPNLNAFALVQEYCRLSKIMNPSDEQSNQLMAILELAQYDVELCSLINEADHLVAYELGLCDDIPIKDYSFLGN